MKHWECKDCMGGIKIHPCTTFFEYEDTPPVACPYNADKYCKWELKEQVEEECIRQLCTKPSHYLTCHALDGEYCMDAWTCKPEDVK
jgi:hypothetical protein